MVNPVAGMGGSVGLHGTDGPALVREARARGARPTAMGRVGPLLTRLRPLGATWVTGAAERDGLGLSSVAVVPEPGGDESDRTRRMAAAVAAAGVDVLVVAGGDGTARDVLDAGVGETAVVVGVPCGVKMFSAVYARSALVAGDLIRHHADRRPGVGVRPLEVMDSVAPEGQREVRLFGYLPGLFRAGSGLRGKAPSPDSDARSVRGAVTELAAEVAAGGTWVVGPGHAGHELLSTLGLAGSLLGVDVVVDGRLVVSDGTAHDVERHAAAATVVLGVVGGQGYLLGRGNQQITPAALRAATRLLVVCGPQKLADLPDRVLLVDTGDAALDRRLRGHVRVLTGYRTSVVVPVR